VVLRGHFNDDAVKSASAANRQASQIASALGGHALPDGGELYL
jgi:hypothetical protein